MSNERLHFAERTDRTILALGTAAAAAVAFECDQADERQWFGGIPLLLPNQLVKRQNMVADQNAAALRGCDPRLLCMQKLPENWRVPPCVAADESLARCNS